MSNLYHTFIGPQGALSTTARAQHDETHKRRIKGSFDIFDRFRRCKTGHRQLFYSTCFYKKEEIQMADFEDSDDSSEDLAPQTVAKSGKKRKRDKSSGKNKKSKKNRNLFDDSAVLSGSEDDDEDEEEDDDENNDYEKDDFVVGEEDDVDENKAKGDLSDSDDSDDDDDDNGRSRKKEGTKRIRRMKDKYQLTEDDLDLIREGRGEPVARRNDAEVDQSRGGVRSSDAAGLQNQLFGDDDELDEGPYTRNSRKDRQEDFFDVDYDDDNFIVDDVHGQDGYGMPRPRKGGSQKYSDYEADENREAVTMGMIEDAVDIFGSDFIEAMQREKEDRDEDDDEAKQRFKEKGVGVDLAMDSDVEVESDDDMSDDDDELDEEAAKLKRDKRTLRKLRKKKRDEARKARLRKAFEPVQLAENFCTEKDDKIRESDIPERYFDWKTPYHEDLSEVQEEAYWIMSRIPEISAEYNSIPLQIPMSEDNDEMQDPSERKREDILNSISEALKFMHKDKLEPEFIRRYRGDIVTSKAVRNNLYEIFDEDTKYDQLVFSRNRVSNMLRTMNDSSKTEEIAENFNVLTEQLGVDVVAAKKKLDDALKQQKEAQESLEKLNITDKEKDNDNDELFGDDDEEDNEKVRVSLHLFSQ